MKSIKSTMHIDPPLVSCGDCRFTSALNGKWSVEDGRLVWRSEASFQDRRGPDFYGCGESSPVVEFDKLEVVDTHEGWDYRVLSDAEFSALKESFCIAMETL